jgi:hypothetical protein
MCCAVQAIDWMREGGGTIFGGCCGVGPAHIKAVAQAADAALSSDDDADGLSRWMSATDALPSGPTAAASVGPAL